MEFPKPQNRAEREALISAFEKIREEWGFAASFKPSMLLEKWKRFVLEVEVGYRLSIEDYTHDLSMRDLLEEVKEAIPPRLREEIDVVLRPYDEIFFLVTQPSINPIDTGVEEGARDWWFRIPYRSGPEIQSYLLEMGLLGRR
jgi:hypothetical protein